MVRIKPQLFGRGSLAAGAPAGPGGRCSGLRPPDGAAAARSHLRERSSPAGPAGDGGTESPAPPGQEPEDGGRARPAGQQHLRLTREAKQAPVGGGF